MRGEPALWQEVTALPTPTALIQLVGTVGFTRGSV
jgi:hypothetical protein